VCVVVFTSWFTSWFTSKLSRVQQRGCPGGIAEGIVIGHDTIEEPARDPFKNVVVGTTRVVIGQSREAQKVLFRVRVHSLEGRCALSRQYLQVRFFQKIFSF